MSYPGLNHLLRGKGTEHRFSVRSSFEGNSKDCCIICSGEYVNNVLTFLIASGPGEIMRGTRLRFGKLGDALWLLLPSPKTSFQMCFLMWCIGKGNLNSASHINGEKSN